MKFTSKHACLGLAEIDRTIVEALRYALEELFRNDANLSYYRA